MAYLYFPSQTFYSKFYSSRIRVHVYLKEPYDTILNKGIGDIETGNFVRLFSFVYADGFMQFDSIVITISNAPCHMGRESRPNHPQLMLWAVVISTEMESEIRSPHADAAQRPVYFASTRARQAESHKLCDIPAELAAWQVQSREGTNSAKRR